MNSGRLPSAAACSCSQRRSSLAAALHHVCVMELTRRHGSCHRFGVQRQLWLPKLLDNCLRIFLITGLSLSLGVIRNSLLTLFCPRAKFPTAAKNPGYGFGALCSGLCLFLWRMSAVTAQLLLLLVACSQGSG